MRRGVAIYARLLALYPRAFRARFGDEMRLLFHDQAAAARGPGAVARLWMRTLLHLVGTAALEHAEARRERRAAAARFPTESRSDRMTTTLATDTRFALRMLRKSPLFTAIAVLVISLGAGAVTTVFSAMNAMMLRPLPGAADASRLVRLERVKRDGSDGILSASYPYYAHLRDHTHTLAGTIAWSKVALTLSTRDEGTAVYGSLVSGNFFGVLGVRPVLGRVFSGDDARDAMARPEIVVSERYWRTRLGGDSAAVGRPLTVNGNAYTLVGVAPAEFAGLDGPVRADAWVPIAMAPQLRPHLSLTSTGQQWLHLAGRVRRGATRDAVRSELATLTGAYARGGAEETWAAAFDDVRVLALSGLPSDATRALGGFLLLLLGAASLVLLIASVNVASMLSARAIARRREMAVRAALGAGRLRLVRQLLTEVLLLFGLGAVGGIVIAAVATSALERMPMPRGSGNVSIVLELSPDLRVAAFAAAVSLLAGVAFGLTPALRGVRRDLTTRLRADTAGAGRRTWAGHMLVVGQLALSLLLLVAAGLFLRALDRGSRVDPGFEGTNVAVARFDTESWGYDSTRSAAFYTTLRERAAALPGVSAVAYSEYLPLTMHGSGDEVQIAGATGSDAARPGIVPASFSYVGPAYFTALRLPLVSGRAFRDADDVRAPLVAVVNETLAHRHWPAGGAVGRTFTFHGTPVTVVGVAHEAKYASLDEGATPMVYLPIEQHVRAGRALLVRAAPGASVGAALQRIVREIDPALPRPEVSTLVAENAIVLLPQRVAAMVTGALGAVGLLLASVGLYGLVTYAVSRRTRELGIRLAIGARRGDVLRMILRDGLRLAGAGVVLGLVMGAAATRLIRGFLFDVSPLDATTFVVTSVLFLAVAALASWLPARRAAGADPLVALRTD